MNEQIRALREKVAAALRDEDCCGATYAGDRVFCDDKRLDEHHKTCPCRNNADAAIVATMQAILDLPEFPASVTDELILADTSGPLAAQNDFKDGLRAFLSLFEKREKA